MKSRALPRIAAATFALATISTLSASTEGDNLIGIGTVSRSLGGNDIAAPQDAIGAIAQNPAALSFLPGNPTSEAEFSLTLFVPHTSASVDGLKGDSAAKTYPIPAFGYSGQIGGKGSPWEFGIAAYGATGLGVDYRNSPLNSNLGPTPYPLVAAPYTQLEVLEVAPSLAYKVSPEWSIGLAVDIDYGLLNLGNGVKTGLGAGVEPAVEYRPGGEPFSFGASYTSVKPITYKAVVDLDGNGLDNLELETPQQFAFGGAYELIPGRLLALADLKWVNWNGAVGYKDFAWRNAWIYGFGLQFEAIPKTLVLRAGYTFGENPVTAHNNFVGAGSPANVTEVQGKFVNNYYYETFRIVGFPAIVENHLALGFSYTLGTQASLDVGYTHAFGNSLSEQGTNLLGAPTTLATHLSEDSCEIGVTWRF
ncbi:MAG: outer membrane protein transport protein [Opitutaceae bacterium]